MKEYTIKSRWLRFKTTNPTKIGPVPLVVQLSSNVEIPWKELRPMLVVAYSHVRQQAARTYGLSHMLPFWKHQMTVTTGNCWRGRAFGRSRTLVRIGELYAKPRVARYPKFKDMPTFWHLDWKEIFVGLCAHELWHNYDPRTGRAAEHDCELVEWDAVDAWRKQCGYTFTPPPDEDQNKTQTEIRTEIQGHPTQSLVLCG